MSKADGSGGGSVGGGEATADAHTTRRSLIGVWPVGALTRLAWLILVGVWFIGALTSVPGARSSAFGPSAL